jgi:hypothetical protein
MMERKGYTEDVSVVITAGRGQSLRLVTGLTTGDRLQTRSGIFPFRFLTNGYRGFSSRVKQPERETNQSFLYGA